MVSEIPSIDSYAAAVDIAAHYRLDVWEVYDELKRIYPDNNDVPIAHLTDLRQQVEQQTSMYEVKSEIREDALALVKKEGFQMEVAQDGSIIYVAEISYPLSREWLLTSWDMWKDRNAKGYSFHYSLYNFDSEPEQRFLEILLGYLNTEPAEIEDIFSTGAIADPKKTDFVVEYKDTEGRWRKYSPDFIVRRKDGKHLIVEIKSEGERSDLIDGEKGTKAMAVREWKDLNPDSLEYRMIFTSTNDIAFDDTKEVRRFLQ